MFTNSMTHLAQTMTQGITAHAEAHVPVSLLARKSLALPRLLCQCEVDLHTFIQLIKRQKFIFGVCLCNITRAKHYAGNARFVKITSVCAKGNAKALRGQRHVFEHVLNVSDNLAVVLACQRRTAEVELLGVLQARTCYGEVC